SQEVIPEIIAWHEFIGQYTSSQLSWMLKYNDKVNFLWLIIGPKDQDTLTS
ncbi:hypothetical protein ACJX0J_027792, partial [Zea mays]